MTLHLEPVLLLMSMLQPAVGVGLLQGYIVTALPLELLFLPVPLFDERWRMFGMVVTALHLLLEGYRWPMVPVYLSLTLQWLMLGKDVTIHTMDDWTGFHVFAGQLLLSTLAAVCKLGFPVPELKPGATALHPISVVETEWIEDRQRMSYARYSASTSSVDSRMDEAELDPLEVSLRIWYPCQVDAKKHPTFHPPAFDPALGTLIARLSHWPRWMFDFLRMTMSAAHVCAPSKKETQNGDRAQLLPIMEDPPSLPIVLVSEDYQVANGISMNNALCENLASRGYVVLSVRHDGRNANALGCVHPFFPNNRKMFTKSNSSQPGPATSLDDWSRDPSGAPNTEEEEYVQHRREAMQRLLARRSREIELVLDRLMMMNYGEVPRGLHAIDAEDEEDVDALTELFKGRLNLEQIAILGHSLGGAIAVNVCSQDRRIRAAIGLDAWTWPLERDILADGLPAPLLLLQQGPSFSVGEDGPYGREQDGDVRRLVANTRSAYLFRLANLTHYDFTDLRVAMPRLGWWNGLLSGIQGFPDPERKRTATVTELLAEYIVAFLEKHTAARCEEETTTFGFGSLVMRKKRTSLGAVGHGSGLLLTKEPLQPPQEKSVLEEVDGRYTGVRVERYGW